MFKDKLREAMILREMTGADLAAASGVPRSGISQYLSGKFTPRGGCLERIADALDLPTAYFTVEDEPQTAAELPGKMYNVPVPMAAKLMGKGQQFIREGLKRGTLPFGYAVGTANAAGVIRYSYYISPVKFAKATGLELSEVAAG